MIAGKRNIKFYFGKRALEHRSKQISFWYYLQSVKERDIDLPKTKEMNIKRKGNKEDNPPKTTKKKRAMKLERAFTAAQATADPNEDDLSMSETVK